MVLLPETGTLEHFLFRNPVHATKTLGIGILTTSCIPVRIFSTFEVSAAANYPTAYSLSSGTPVFLLFVLVMASRRRLDGPNASQLQSLWPQF